MAYAAAGNILDTAWDSGPLEVLQAPCFCTISKYTGTPRAGAGRMAQVLHPCKCLACNPSGDGSLEQAGWIGLTSELWAKWQNVAQYTGESAQRRQSTWVASFHHVHNTHKRTNMYIHMHTLPHRHTENTPSIFLCPVFLCFNTINQSSINTKRAG